MDAVDHINVDVDALEPCYEFYRDVLDLELVRPPDDFQGCTRCFGPARRS